MVQCRIGIDYCATHLRIVDLNHRLQDMTHDFGIPSLSSLHDLRANILRSVVTYAYVLYSHYFR
jgi:hypothetical protein